MVYNSLTLPIIFNYIDDDVIVMDDLNDDLATLFWFIDRDVIVMDDLNDDLANTLREWCTIA